MLKETFDSIKAALNERVTSPFLGAFSICWLIVNWKIPVLILKSDLPIEQTIAQIENTNSVFNRLLIPLAIALVILFIYPWITFYVFRYFNIVDIKKRIAKQNGDLRILKSKESLIQAEADLETMKAISLMRIDEQKRILVQNTAENERHSILNREQQNIDTEFYLLRHRLEQEKNLRHQFPNVVLPHTPIGNNRTQNQT